jgi:hypothetical protein
MAQADEQSFEVVLPRFLDLAPVDVNVVDRQLLCLDEVIKVEAERTDVFCQFYCGFFEGEEYARLIVQHGSSDKEFDSQESFSATSATTYQGGPAFGQPATRDLVQPWNASGTLRQTRWRRFLFRYGLGHGAILLDRLFTRHRRYSRG